jgi:hypothetical protein
MSMQLINSRRRRLTGAAALMVAASMLALGPSQAVHDEGFALQGNLFGTGIDWEDLFDVAGSPTVTTPKATLPANFTAASFAKDWVLPDSTGYATGSKDTLPISLAGGGDWQCKTPNNLGSKFDLVNAYAAAYIPTTGDDAGDLIVYFGSEVSAPEGNRNMGVWLLQDPAVSCSGAGNTDFSGSHVDGDVFVVSAFTNGGNTANIDVYEWVDSSPGDDDADVGGSLVLKQGFTNAKCPINSDPPLTDDRACAIANTDGDKDTDETAFEVNPPWDAPDKDGGNLNEAQFMEGGVNLSELGLSGCFPTFLANSRSSQIPGATLHDFARSSFEQCGAGIATVPSSSSIVLGGSLTDTATVTVSGANPPAPTGNVTFYVCGPSAGLSSCVPANGTQVGAAKNLAGATQSGNAYSVTSDQFTPTTAGDYCFAASWPGDSTYNDGPYVDGSSVECFTVVALQPTISTAQSFYPNDSATVTVASGAGELTGSVRFRLYQDAACAGTAILDQSVALPAGAGLSKTVSTSNTTVAVSTSTTLSWLVQFTSTNNGILNVTSACNVESTTLSIDNDTTVP